MQHGTIQHQLELVEQLVVQRLVLHLKPCLSGTHHQAVNPSRVLPPCLHTHAQAHRTQTAYKLPISQPGYPVAQCVFLGTAVCRGDYAELAEAMYMFFEQM